MLTPYIVRKSSRKRNLKFAANSFDGSQHLLSSLARGPFFYGVFCIQKSAQSDLHTKNTFEKETVCIEARERWGCPCWLLYTQHPQATCFLFSYTAFPTKSYVLYDALKIKANISCIYPRATEITDEHRLNLSMLKASNILLSGL